jgi:rRNA maturation protein Nop10
MGGRGRDSGLGFRQVSIADAIKQRIIGDILNEKAKGLKASSGNSEGSDPTILLRKCACCGAYTIPINTCYESCPECGWIDDPFQNLHPDSLDGANKKTLKQARHEYEQRKI